MTATRPVLFAYDGSDHARAAIARAGALLQPGPAVVVTVWSTLSQAAPSTLRVISCDDTYFTEVVSCADELDATVIVMGSRGRSTVAAMFLGSVSTGVVHHTQRPVLVVQASD